MDVRNFENLQKSQNLRTFLSDLIESTTNIGPFFVKFMVILLCDFRIIQNIFFNFSKICFFTLKKVYIYNFREIFGHFALDRG